MTGMEHPFKDVAENQYYSDAVTWASAHGSVRGVTKTKFLPNAAVTREQMAVLLYRYADYKGYDMAVEGDLSRFPDGEKTSEYAEAAMCWAVSVGLFQGIAGGDAIWLKPQNGATRAQAATVLVRFLEKFPHNHSNFTRNPARKKPLGLSARRVFCIYVEKIGQSKKNCPDHEQGVAVNFGQRGRNWKEARGWPIVCVKNNPPICYSMGTIRWTGIPGVRRRFPRRGRRISRYF